MMTWTVEELTRIGDAEEIQLASLRRDGALRKPVIIWVVRVGDDLYVRSVYGRSSAWFRGVQVRLEGRIWAGGVEKDVAFEEVSDSDLIDRIGGAYRTKYHRYPQYVAPLLVPEARAATLRLMPRSTDD